MVLTCKDGSTMSRAVSSAAAGSIDNGKYVRYTPEQIEVLEKFYLECRKPSSVRGQQLIIEFPILSNIETEQIKALQVFTFSHEAGLDMLETTLIALQYIPLEKIFDDHGRKNICSQFPQK